MKTLQDLELAIQPLDARLRPIAKGKLDISGPDWGDKLRALLANPPPPAVDRAGVREEAGRVLADFMQLYAGGSDADREGIRELLRKYDSFAWAAVLPKGTMTADRFRSSLILFSMRDQHPDWRDAIVELDNLCATALAGGLGVADTLMEIAALSSDVDPFDWPWGGRSMRKMLVDYSKRFQRVLN